VIPVSSSNYPRTDKVQMVKPRNNEHVPGRLVFATRTSFTVFERFLLDPRAPIRLNSTLGAGPRRNMLCFDFCGSQLCLMRVPMIPAMTPNTGGTMPPPTSNIMIDRRTRTKPPMSRPRSRR